METSQLVQESSQKFKEIKQRKIIDLSLPADNFNTSLRLPRIGQSNKLFDNFIEEKTHDLNTLTEEDDNVEEFRLPSALRSRSSFLRRKDSTVSVISSTESSDDINFDDFITFDGHIDEHEEQDILFQNGEDDEQEQVEFWENTVKLTAKEEKEIEKTVRRECMDEFQKIMKDAHEKQSKIKKHFKKLIDEARKMLVTARVQAEISSVSKLEAIAEQTQEEIYLERERRKSHLRKANDPISDETLSYKEWVKSRVNEMDTLRKLQSNLDRARARRRNSVAAGATIDKNGSVELKKLAAMELRRLERVKDIQTLVDELTEIGLEDKALELKSSLQSKAQFEVTYTKELIAEKKRARNDANRRKREEIEKLRKSKLAEKYAEKQRLEREKREREELERQRRIAEALKRREVNLKMKRLYQETLLETSISRAYRFSYF